MRDALTEGRPGRPRLTTREGSIWWSDVAHGRGCQEKTTDGHFSRDGWREPGRHRRQPGRAGASATRPSSTSRRNDGIDESNRMSGSCYPVNPTRLPGPCAPVFFCARIFCGRRGCFVGGPDILWEAPWGRGFLGLRKAFGPKGPPTIDPCLRPQGASYIRSMGLPQ